MYSLLFLAATSCLLSLVLTPLLRDLCLRAGFVDHPDQHRKIHRTPVPRAGGVAIALAFTGACALLLATPLTGGAILGRHLPLVWKLLPAAGLVFATGLIDDLFGLKPWQKLTGQFAGAAVAWWGGVRIAGVGEIQTAGWLSLSLTLVWLIGCTNAFNLIDGVDGLASGIGLFAACTTMCVALLHGNVALAVATAPLAGALLGFLRYNFNPASIFLGDSGSLQVGFLLGCYAVLWSQKSATVIAMTAPMMVLAVPIADVFLAIGRRYLRRLPIFDADRGHIHHRLLDRGLTPRGVALLMYCVCALGAALALILSVTSHAYAPAAVAVFLILAGLGVANLGYIEFAVARRVLFDGTIRRVVSDEIRLRQMRDRIEEALTPNDCWLAIRDAAAGFGFSRLHLRINGEAYECQLAPGPANQSWTLRIPVPDCGYVNCTRALNAVEPITGLAKFAETVSRALQTRAPLLRPSGAIDPSLAALASHLSAEEIKETLHS